jgi:serine protease SohB
LEYLAEYGIFLAKTLTLLIALLVAVAGIAAVATRNRTTSEGHIEVKCLNDDYDDLTDDLKASILSEEDFKKDQKQQKQIAKAEAKARKKG